MENDLAYNEIRVRFRDTDLVIPAWSLELVVHVHTRYATAL